MSFRVLLLAAMVSVLTPVGAGAMSWMETFRSAGTLVVGQDDSVLIVAAGVESESLRKATQGLTEAVRAHASFVMDAAGLGDVAELDDASIVLKAKHLPVARIAILRHFPGSGGGTSVVSVYGKDQRVLVSFSARAGVPVASPGAGVTAEAIEAVESVHEESALHHRMAVDRYKRSYLRLEREVEGSFSVFRGERGVKLEGDRFYEVVGRRDLAKEYRARVATKRRLQALGGVLMVVGALYPIFEIGMETCTTEGADWGGEPYEVCEYNLARSLLVTGGLLAGGGSLLAIGNAVDPHPVSMAAARELIMEHNKRVERSLELSAALIPGGAGLSVSGRF